MRPFAKLAALALLLVGSTTLEITDNNGQVIERVKNAVTWSFPSRTQVDVWDGTNVTSHAVPANCIVIPVTESDGEN